VRLAGLIKYVCSIKPPSGSCGRFFPLIQTPGSVKGQMEGVYILVARIEVGFAVPSVYGIVLLG